MLKIFLVRPGSTEFDEQGRIKGCLDIPLSLAGLEQVQKVALELGEFDLARIYTSPCQSAQQTAAGLSRGGKIKVKVIEGFANLDHGLWHGKRIEELKLTQPRIYRQFADNPETTCPPEGETLQAARDRVIKSLNRVIRKNREGQVVVVVPDPLATIVHAILESEEIGDLWQSECESCHWEVIDVNAKKLESTG